MKIMCESQRKKIRTYIKNNLDISDLIKDYSIKNEDLSGAIISKFNRCKDNMSGVNLSNCIIGKRGTVNNISGSNLKYSRWCNAEIKGILFMRKCNCRNADFSKAILNNLEYQNTDFTDGKFCGACIRIGTDSGWGAKFSSDFFKDLAKGWSVKVLSKSKEELENE